MGCNMLSFFIHVNLLTGCMHVISLTDQMNSAVLAVLAVPCQPTNNNVTEFVLALGSHKDISICEISILLQSKFNTCISCLIYSIKFISAASEYYVLNLFFLQEKGLFSAQAPKKPGLEWSLVLEVP